MTALAVSASCGGSQKSNLTSIDISSSGLIVKVGSDLQLMANLRYPPPRGPLTTGSPVAWSSSDPLTASVNPATGVVRGVKVGTATITATHTPTRKTATTLITVTADRVMTGLALEPVAPRVGIGLTIAMTARAMYSDGTNAAVNDQALWTTSDATVARVTPSGTGLVGGLILGVKAGTATITARVGTFSAMQMLTVSGATLRSLAVTPAMAQVARQVNFDFKATATFTDNSTMDVTPTAMWMSSAAGIATVAGGRATGVAPGQANITATYMNMTATARLTVTNLAPTSLTVTPATATLPLTTTEKLTATARFTDNSTQDVSTAATWTSSAPLVAAVDGNGVVTALSVGTATITAVFGNNVGTSFITVTNATLTSIAVTPVTQTLSVGLKQQYAATAIYSDGQQRVATNDVTWATLNQAVAGISNAVGSKGELTAVAAGDTMVTASLGDKVGSANLTVTTATLTALAISPSNERAPVGIRVSYEARALFSDGSNRVVTDDVTWSSSTETVASISNADGSEGQASALAVGTTTISAAFGQMTQSTTLTVTTATLASITVTPVTRTVARGTSVQLVATGIYTDNSNFNLTELADWTSSVSANATVSSADGTRGLVTGVNAGVAVITASFGGQNSSATVTVTTATLVSIAISPTNQTVGRGSLVDFEASGVFSDSTTQDLTTQVTWSSGTLAAATISNASPTRGRATTLAPGATVITATFGTISAMTNLTVTNATLSSIAVSPATNRIAATTRVSLSAIGTFSDATTQDLTEEAFWFSSNTAVATVSIALGDEGEVTGVTPGTATITATFGGRNGTGTVEVTNATLTSIAVTPPGPTISLGNIQQFQATGTFSDASTQDLTDQVTWTTSNAAVAVASNVDGSEGQVIAVAVGSVTVTAAFGTVTGTTTLTVNNSTLTSISVTRTPASIASGSTSQFTATGLYADNSNQDLTNVVTWSSGTPGVASISNSAGTRGLATGGTPGTSVITATLGSVSGMATLTVTSAVLSTVAITPANPSIARNTTQTFIVTGTYDDNTTQDLTAAASWTSSNTMFATISNTAPNIGVATAVNPGTAVITATVGGKVATTNLTVTPATLASLQITQVNPSVVRGSTLSFTVNGTYTDMTTQVLTTTATWTSSNTAVATISNATGNEGVATALTVGTTNITATVGSISSAAQVLTVTAGTLTGLSVNPPTPSIANGTTQQFTVTGTYSDMSTAPLTASATWSTVAGTGTATVSNAGGSEGLVTATGVGTVTVRAIYMGMMADATLTVTAATLSRIEVTPLTTANSPLGLAVQYTATGVYTDNSTQPMTTGVTWSSSNMAVATISNAGGSQGLASTIAQGTTTISATNGTLTSAPATLTVGPATVASVAIGGLAKIANLTMSQLSASATYTDGQVVDVTTQATWGSSNTGVAQIDTTTGIVTGISPGTITLTASFGGQVGMRSFEVSNATIVSMALDPSAPTIADGTTQQFQPVATFSDATTQNMILQATWASSLSNIASISNAAGSKGLATGLDAGMSTISAVWNGISGGTVLTVSPAVLVSISVTPSLATVIVGTTRRFTATGIYTDSSTQDLTNFGGLTWSSSTANATIDNAAGINKGTATGVSIGTPTITAAVGMISGTASLTVTGSEVASIAITANALGSVAAGAAEQYTATATLTGGGTRDVTADATWSSSGPGVATVSNVDGSRGLVTGITPGMANISASYAGVSSNTASITVTNAVVTSITVTTPSASVPNGVDPQFTAIGTFTDGSMQNITGTVTWGSSDTNVATIAGGGLATTLTMGTTNITATSGMIVGTTPLTVTAATLTSITVTPANDNMNPAATKQYVATGNFTDGPQVITLQVTWSSTAAGVATISNAMGSVGLATGIATGSTMIRATFNGVSGSTNLTIN